MAKCLIGVGSNLGNSREILDGAVEHLAKTFDVLAVSKWFAYPAIGPVEGEDQQQPDFLNGVLVLESSLNPQDTANILHETEKLAGRERIVRWSSRTLDVDLLLYGDETVQTKTLQVPHPRMMSRRFVLEPACQVAPEMLHPSIGWSMKKIFSHLRDEKPYFSVIGTDSQKTQLFIERLQAEVGGAIIPNLDSAPNVPSPDRNQLIQYVTEKMATLKSHPTGPWFGNFWIGELSLRPDCENAEWAKEWHPKLVLVTDPEGSEFAKRLRLVSPQLQVPKIFLSVDESDAWQDALGAVQGMS